MFKLLPERPEFAAYIGPPQRAPRAEARHREGQEAAGRAGGIVECLHARASPWRAAVSGTRRRHISLRTQLSGWLERSNGRRASIALSGFALQYCVQGVYVRSLTGWRFGGIFMKRMSGRNIYITDLNNVLAKSGGPGGFAALAKESRFSAVWIRVGRGPGRDKNLDLPELPVVQAALANAGVELWGWHVPFCANQAAAEDEATKVLQWAEQFALTGVLLDAEKTDEVTTLPGRFGGSADLCREDTSWSVRKRARAGALEPRPALASHRPSIPDLPRAGRR